VRRSLTRRWPSTPITPGPMLSFRGVLSPCGFIDGTMFVLGLRPSTAPISPLMWRCGWRPICQTLTSRSGWALSFMRQHAAAIAEFERGD